MLWADSLDDHYRAQLEGEHYSSSKTSSVSHPRVDNRLKETLLMIALTRWEWQSHNTPVTHCLGSETLINTRPVCMASVYEHYIIYIHLVCSASLVWDALLSWITFWIEIKISYIYTHLTFTEISIWISTVTLQWWIQWFQLRYIKYREQVRGTQCKRVLWYVPGSSLTSWEWQKCF